MFYFPTLRLIKQNHIDMKKFFLLAVLSLCLGTAANAQWGWPKTANDSLVSVEALTGNKVALRIYAPDAEKVSFSGDIWGANVKFTKDDRGVWEGILEGVAPGAYRYHFVVDGVNVYDPKAPEASETSAVMKIDPSGDAFWAVKDVPHGAMAQRYYWSETLGTTRRLHVWTPPGYETSSDKLPVFYLIHGGGDTDNSWPGVGCAGFILDNLYAEGQIVPMVVVMPNGSIATDSLEGEVPLFTQDLMTSIIPFIESNYRVLTDKDNRALGGLSMGGMETLDAGLNNYKEFGWLLVLSSGWFENQTEFYAEREAYLKTVVDGINEGVNLFAITMGGPEDIAYNNCKAMMRLFDSVGLKYEYSEAPGGHSWHTWRRDLHNLAPRLFKK